MNNPPHLKSQKQYLYLQCNKFMLPPKNIQACDKLPQAFYFSFIIAYCAFKNMDFCFTNSLKTGSCKSLIKRIASPVDFISGPSCLSTSGNLEKENTGSLIAHPVSLRSIVKSFSLFSPNITLVAILT